MYQNLLLQSQITATVQLWLQEDVPSFDYGGYVVGEKHEHAVLFAKQSGVLAGRPFFDEVFRQVECSVRWLVDEGQYITVEEHGRLAVAHVKGAAHQLLRGERLALNIIARASGIASRARRLVQIKESLQWPGVVAGTRKTTPGFRLVEKYAMLVGGVDMHRMDLSSMIMLKDNHIWSQGSITEAVRKARKVGGFSLKIEVECCSFGEAEEAIQAGCDIVMLDNFDAQIGILTAAELKSKYPNVLIEVSGGLTEDNIASYMKRSSIDILSCGSLSQSVPHIDFSLKIQPSPATSSSSAAAAAT